MNMQVRPSSNVSSNNRSRLLELETPGDSTAVSGTASGSSNVSDRTTTAATMSPLTYSGAGSARLQQLDDFARMLRTADAIGSEPDAAGGSFEQRFAELSANPDAFHSLLAQVYGEGYDRTAAETLRMRALDADFGWLPGVEYVGAEELGGANGAYAASSDMIYINENLRGTALEDDVIAEEAGHALDIQLNGGADTAGDEGELFRRLLSGETLSAEQVAAIRSDNDNGFLTINGESHAVEFWNPFKKAWDWTREKIIKPAGRFLDDNVLQPIKEHVVKPIAESTIGRKVISWTMGKLHSFGTWLDRVTGAPAERGLSPDEIAYLRPIYGNSIDYSAIRIQQGGVKDVLNMRSNTVGHDIFMSEDHSDTNMRDAAGNLTNAGREWLSTLGHEAMHVWQFEQQGSGYIGDALVAQWFGDGYNLQVAFDEGKAFADMNPEQQGMMAQFIGLAILDDGAGALTETGFEAVSGIALSPAQFQVVQDAHAALLAG